MKRLICILHFNILVIQNLETAGKQICMQMKITLFMLLSVSEELPLILVQLLDLDVFFCQFLL